MDAVSFIKERLALADAGDWQADKFIWSIAIAKNARLTAPSVNLRNLRLKILRVSSFLRGEKISVFCVICGNKGNSLFENYLASSCLSGESKNPHFRAKNWYVFRKISKKFKKIRKKSKKFKKIRKFLKGFVLFPLPDNETRVTTCHGIA